MYATGVFDHEKNTLMNYSDNQAAIISDII